MKLQSLPDGAGVDVAKLRDCMLILPAVAFANIGELSIDLLVCTLHAKLAGRVSSDNVLACVGNNAYQPDPQGLLATAMELYHVPGTDIYLLQQRAPAIPGRQKAFAAELAAWVRDTGCTQVLLLCGLDAQYRREQQLEGPQLRYLSSSSNSSSSSEPGSQQVLQLGQICQEAGLLPLEAAVIENEKELHGLLPPWPTLGELQSAGVQHTLLSVFAAEGDNQADAMQLAQAVLTALGAQGLLQAEQQQQQLQVPCSWVGLFGRRGIDSTLF